MRTELTDRSAAEDAGVMLVKLKGRMAPGHVSSEKVEAFCARLEGYTHFSYHESMARPDPTPLHAGFHAVRGFDARDGVLLGSIWHLGAGRGEVRAGFGFKVTHRRPAAMNVLDILLIQPLEEMTAWHGTRAVPSEHPGVLDLLVDIETRPRENLFDGEPLLPHLVAFLARKAPKRV